MYFLWVNIFASLMVGFNVSFHFENHRYNSSIGSSVSILLRIQELGFVLLKLYRLRTLPNGSVVTLVNHITLPIAEDVK